MKKQRFFMLGIITVLVAVLSLTFVSSTFAKYTSSGSATDTARVAKWGVKVALSGETFTKAYGDTVESKTYDVVAPGTSGNLAAASVTGTPEVKVQVTYTADLELANWIDGYCPLVFTVNGTSIAKNDAETIDQFEARVEAAIVASTKSYNPNTNLAEVNDDLKVSWSWIYYSSDANDVKDTALGDAAANGTAATVSLSVTLTITQVE